MTEELVAKDFVKYCVKTSRYDGSGKYYNHIYQSIVQVRMCVEEDEPIYKIVVTEDTNPDEDSYWGWMENDGTIGMVYPVEFLFEMCFPYGSAHEERKGRGRKIRVATTEVGMCDC